MSVVRKKTERGAMLAIGIVTFVRERIMAVGFDAAVGELNEAVTKCNMNPGEVDARGRLRVLVEDNNHRFQAYWSTIFGVWAGRIQNAVEVPRLETVEIEAAPVSQVVVTEQPTGIVRCTEVDGVVVPWTLPTLTREGAEQARVTLTDLAGVLGYENRQGLDRLAERNDEELREFGGIDTVSVPVKAGFTMRIIQEPTYNQDQCVILGLASHTDVGRKMRPMMLKAYKSLLAMFEQAVSAPPSGALERVLEALVSNQSTTNLLLQSLLSKGATRRRVANPAQIIIPQTAPGASAEAEPKQKTFREPHGNPRLAAIPDPSSVSDSALFPTLKNMISIYGKSTGAFDVAHNLVYDACDRTPGLGVDLKKYEHGTRIQIIGSQSKRVQRKILELAYDVLVRPYVTRAA